MTRYHAITCTDDECDPGCDHAQAATARLGWSTTTRRVGSLSAPSQSLTFQDAMRALGIPEPYPVPCWIQWQGNDYRWEVRRVDEDGNPLSDWVVVQPHNREAAR